MSARSDRSEDLRQIVCLSDDDAIKYRITFGSDRLPGVRFRNTGLIEVELSRWWMLQGFFAAMEGKGRQQGKWRAASTAAIHWIYGWDHHLYWSTHKPIRRRKKKRKSPQPDRMEVTCTRNSPIKLN